MSNSINTFTNTPLPVRSVTFIVIFGRATFTASVEREISILSSPSTIVSVRAETLIQYVVSDAINSIVAGKLMSSAEIHIRGENNEVLNT